MITILIVDEISSSSILVALYYLYCDHYVSNLLCLENMMSSHLYYDGLQFMAEVGHSVCDTV